MPIKLVKVESALDGGKVTRLLRRRGAASTSASWCATWRRRLHTRIEMKQIGARDETKLARRRRPVRPRAVLLDAGCASSSAVSVKMAKEQGLSLNPSKLAGMCGRLKCCLRYEYDTYLELGRALPPVGTQVESVKGDGVVVRQNVLKQTVVVRRDEDGVEVEAHARRPRRRRRPH